MSTGTLPDNPEESRGEKVLRLRQLYDYLVEQKLRVEEQIADLRDQLEGLGDRP